VSECSACGAAILWARTSGGKATPLDAEPVHDGEWQILAGVTVVAGLQPGPRYRVHWATCPRADEFRRAR